MRDGRSLNIRGVYHSNKFIAETIVLDEAGALFPSNDGRQQFRHEGPPQSACVILYKMAQRTAAPEVDTNGDPLWTGKLRMNEQENGQNSAR